MATSGTLLQTPYNQQKVIEHAVRRAGQTPERMSAELNQVASETLYSLLSQYVNAGYPLWTRVFSLLGGQIGNPNIAVPSGTVDLHHAYWRVLNPWRGTATLTNGADGSVLFGGQPNADVTIPGPNPGIIANLGTSPGVGNMPGGGAEIDTLGVLSGGGVPIQGTVELYTSPDGVNWTFALQMPTGVFTPGTWTYMDLKPTIVAPFLKISAPTAGSWVVNQFNIGLAYGQDIELGKLNIDDYYNLPDKMFRSDRPNSLYWDRLGDTPQIKIWPTMNTAAFYNGCVSALTRRYIQDPGALAGALEVPARWLEAVQWRLANVLLHEWPEDPNVGGNYFTLMAKQQRIQMVQQEATKAEALCFAEERTDGPRRWTPDLSPYTR